MRSSSCASPTRRRRRTTRCRGCERSATAIEPLADRVLVYTDDGDATAAAIADDGVRRRVGARAAGSLEDVFLILTGRTLED